MPFRTPPGAARDLLSLIDAELRDRIEEAVDHGCLEAMVSARRHSGARLPKADDVRDREEFTATLRALLARLRAELPPATAGPSGAGPPRDSGITRRSGFEAAAGPRGREPIHEPSQLVLQHHIHRIHHCTSALTRASYTQHVLGICQARRACSEASGGRFRRVKLRE